MLLKKLHFPRVQWKWSSIALSQFSSVPLHSIRVNSSVPLHSIRIKQNNPFHCTLTILIRQKALRVVFVVNFRLVSVLVLVLVSAIASLNGTINLSPHENILTIALINIHYLYTICLFIVNTWRQLSIKPRKRSLVYSLLASAHLQ